MRCNFFYLNTFSVTLYKSVKDLPEQWSTLSSENIFLSKEYLAVLENTSPKNMNCIFIGVFKNNALCGIFVSQYLNLTKVETFGERDKQLKTHLRNLTLRNFCSHVLFIGNNMLSGQNAYIFSKTIAKELQTEILELVVNKLITHYAVNKIKIHLTSIKDFSSNTANSLQEFGLKDYYKFSTQPNMVFSINNNWHKEEDYINALTKKYRDQYKRARNKANGIEKKKLNLTEIIENQECIYNLYLEVAKNAPFNTFILPKNHFAKLKEELDKNFLFYAYFLNNEMIGFNTLIKNGNVMDTYFLGYNATIQKEKMLYLNMLYDMVAYSINKGFKEIVFARTALEIKSSVGAKPLEMNGFIKHTYKIIDNCLPFLFTYLEPVTEWKERNPFK